MSKEDLKKFVKDSAEDKKLQEILEKGGNMNNSSKDQIEYVVREAQSHGYDFTVDEFVGLFKKSDSKSGEIMDDELSDVAGGTGPIYDFCIKVKRGFEDLIEGPPSITKKAKRKLHDFQNNLNLDNKWYRKI